MDIYGGREIQKPKLASQFILFLIHLTCDFAIVSKSEREERRWGFHGLGFWIRSCDL